MIARHMSVHSVVIIVLCFLTITLGIIVQRRDGYQFRRDVRVNGKLYVTGSAHVGEIENVEESILSLQQRLNSQNDTIVSQGATIRDVDEKRGTGMGELEARVVGNMRVVQRIDTVSPMHFEFFEMESDKYLAVGSTGSVSDVYKYDRNVGEFAIIQSITGDVPIDFRHFFVDGEHYALSVDLYPRHGPTISTVYRWDGSQFQSYQVIPLSFCPWAAEVFYLNETVFAVFAAYHDTSDLVSTSSPIYVWKDGTFVLHQNIDTHAARSFKFFEMGNSSFLVVANGGLDDIIDCWKQSVPAVDSVIYRWDGEKFVSFQSIPTHAAHRWEYFEMEGVHYLFVTNSHNSSTYDINSILYSWTGEYFEEIQSFPTHGALDAKYFSIDGIYHYLIIINGKSGEYAYNYMCGPIATHYVNSEIYWYNGNEFVVIQKIPSIMGSCATVFKHESKTCMVLGNFYHSNNGAESKSTIYCNMQMT